jgi:hypothetical protein
MAQRWNKLPSSGTPFGQRGARYSGKSRILRRLALGVVKSLEVEDASPISAALLTLRRWVERVAEGEAGRLAERCAAHHERLGHVPKWVLAGMDARWERVGALEHRVQMLLGIFAACGVLPLEFKPAHSVGDLLVQQLDELEREADEKGGVAQVLADHFAHVYRVGLPQIVAARPPRPHAAWAQGAGPDARVRERAATRCGVRDGTHGQTLARS